MRFDDYKLRTIIPRLAKQIEASEEPVHSVLCDVISGSVTFIMSTKGSSDPSIFTIFS